MKRFLIITATRGMPPPPGEENTPVTTSLRDMEAYNITSTDHQVIIRHGNKIGLPEIYNTYITKEYLNDYEGIIFVHDDVYIDDPKFLEKLRTHFKEGYSVVGLAGAGSAKIGKPALWHLMSERGHQAGAVAHPYNDTTTYVTAFGPTPRPCLIMDGLFLAINCEKFKKTPVKFDEQFTFHHYDLDFCLQCNEHKHKLVAININVIHNSPGLLNPDSKMFLDSQDKFIKKYAKN